jgi:hypothetical protein
MTNRINPRRLALCFCLVTGTLIGPLTGLALADYRHEHWREGYRHRPDVYYSAPPVVYPPYGYYQAPAASLNFNFPLIIR